MDSPPSGDLKLKLPDHILHRTEDIVTITERKSGRSLSIKLPTEPKVLERRSPLRYLGALACAIFVSYFSFMFLQDLFASYWEIVALPVIMFVPFLVERASNGGFAVAAYLTAYLSFALLRGAMGGHVNLGIIFFGSGPLSYEGYAIVPASNLVAALLLGMLPYVVLKMLGQVMVRIDVVIASPGGDCTISIRRGGLAREIISFLSSQGNADASRKGNEPRNASI